MSDRSREALVAALGVIAPGQPLRQGLDRILQANKGALIVVGDGPEVLEICSGGLLLDAEFSPPRLSELAKMDGAIILAADASRIARANVHLVPSPVVPTSETGTRHRTAERVARSIDVPVVAVSEDLGVITVYRGDQKRPLESIPRLLGRANQGLQTLERYRHRLDSVTNALSALEVEDLVTLRDVVSVIQRAEMVRRIAGEVQGSVVELGGDGRLVHLQLEELLAGVDDSRRQVIRDYLQDTKPATLKTAMQGLHDMSTEMLLDVKAVAVTLHLASEDGYDPDTSVRPLGYRLLAKVPRLPAPTINKIVGRYGNLQAILAASVADLHAVDGVSRSTALVVKDGLARLAESSILDRYG
ncbi:MAG: DNA integrity scanning diadenylate cyclase DisA [Acidimicrobiales bacterium]